MSNVQGTTNTVCSHSEQPHFEYLLDMFLSRLTISFLVLCVDIERLQKAAETTLKY